MEVRFAAALLALVLAPPAAAEEWIVPTAPGDDQSFALATVLPSDDGYIVLGHAGQPIGTYWTRVTVDGRASPAARSADIVPVSSHQRVSVYPLGGDRFLAGPDRDPATERCRLRLTDGDGRVHATALFDGNPCNAGVDPDDLRRDATGGVWLTTFNLPHWLRLQADGRLRTIELPPDASGPTTFARSAALSRESAVYVAYRTGDRRRLAKINASGVAWSRVPPEPSIELSSELVVLADDDVVVAGRVGSRVGDPLWLARYSPQGVLRWQRTYPEVAHLDAMYARPMAGGRIAIGMSNLFDRNRPSSLHGFTTEGTPLWRIDLPGERLDAFASGAYPDVPDGLPAFAVTLRRPDPSAPGAPVLEHISADGVRLGRFPEGRAAVLRDGSLVRSVPDGGLSHVDLRGSVRPVPDLGSIAPTSRVVLRGAVDDEGSAYALNRDDEVTVGAAATLRAFDAGGSLRWTREFAYRQIDRADLPDDPARDRQARIAIGADRVCIGPVYTRHVSLIVRFLRLDHAVRCFARTDGSPLLTVRSLPPPATNSERELLPAIAVRADGSVVLVEDLNRVIVSPFGAVSRTALVGMGITTSSGGEGQGSGAVADAAPDGRVAMVGTLLATPAS